MHSFSLISLNCWVSAYIPLAVYICASAVPQFHAVITVLLAQPFSKGTAQNMLLLLPEIRLEFSFPRQVVL